MKKTFLSFLLVLTMTVCMMPFNSPIALAKDKNENTIITPQGEVCPYYESNHIFETISTYYTLSDYTHLHPISDGYGGTVYANCKVMRWTGHHDERCACGRTKTVSWIDSENHYIGSIPRP